MSPVVKRKNVAATGAAVIVVKSCTLEIAAGRYKSIDQIRQDIFPRTRSYKVILTYNRFL